MSRIGAFTAAMVLAAATALAGAAGTYAKGGGGHGGGGGGHGGGGHGGGHAAHGGGGHGGGHGFRMGGRHGGGHGLRMGGRHGGGHGLRMGGGHRGGMHGLRRGGGRHMAAPRGFGRHASRRAGALGGHGRSAMRRAAAANRAAAVNRAAVGRHSTTGFAGSAAGPRRFAGHGRVQGALAAHLYARPAFRAAIWPGPFFWSYESDDVFWPTAYDDVFWTYGTADIVTGILLPDAYARSGYGAPRRGARSARAALHTPPDAAALCGDAPVDLADLAGVEADVQPTGEQRALFEDLKAAEAKAMSLLRAACPSQPPATATGRLDAMAQWFAAMRQAVRTVRPPLEAFYAALTDEQKARFFSAAGERRDAAARWLARCRAAPRGIANMSTQGVARTLNLDDPQVAALNDLSRASDQAADALAGTCPQEIPLTPTGRLAAIETRLGALVGALDTLRPALERFYAALSDAQKARFNAIGARSSRRAG